MLFPSRNGLLCILSCFPSSPVIRFPGLLTLLKLPGLPKALADLGPLGKWPPLGVSAKLILPLELVSLLPAGKTTLLHFCDMFPVYVRLAQSLSYL